MLWLYDETLINPEGGGMDCAGLGVLNRQRAEGGGGGGARGTVTPTVLTSGSSTTDGSSIATASVSPTANRVVYAAIVHQVASVTTPTLTGAGMTWVQEETTTFATSRRITVFRALSASPGSGALTFDFGGQSQASFVWSVVECSGVDTSGANGAGATIQSVAAVTASGSTSATSTLAALEHANNVHLCFVGLATFGTVTPDADFVELSDNNVDTSNLTLEVEWAANQTDCTSTFGSTIAATVSLEVKSS